MSQEVQLREFRTFTLTLSFGPYGGVFQFSIDPTDKEDLIKTLNEILQLAKAPLLAEIESLKKRALSPDEIQRFVYLLRQYSEERTLDGRPTDDGPLTARLERLLNN